MRRRRLGLDCAGGGFEGEDGQKGRACDEGCEYWRMMMMMADFESGGWGL